MSELRGLRPRWKPGESGNPSGSSAAVRLAKLVRVETKRGRELVDFMLAVMRGERITAAGADRRAKGKIANLAQRVSAAEWLADRGYGRARELVEISGDVVSSQAERLAMLRRLSPEDRELIRATLAKASAGPPGGELLVDGS